mgnify:CR=1 FL=1
MAISLVVGLAACGEGTKAPAATSMSTLNPTTSTLVPPDGKRSDERSLTLFDTIANDNLQPKSIVHSGTGLFFAQNMMYRHNISVFNRQSNLIATIDYNGQQIDGSTDKVLSLGKLKSKFEAFNAKLSLRAAKPAPPSLEVDR